MWFIDCLIFRTLIFVITRYFILRVIISSPIMWIILVMKKWIIISQSTKNDSLGASNSTLGIQGISAVTASKVSSLSSNSITSDVSKESSSGSKYADVIFITIYHIVFCMIIEGSQNSLVQRRTVWCFMASVVYNLFASFNYHWPHQFTIWKILIDSNLICYLASTDVIIASN